MKERLGGRLRTPISGGAPLAKEIAEFFDAIGVRILEGYGLTECTTAATTNRPTATASAPSAPRCPASSCGSPRTASSLVRSETVFAGYFKEPEATAEVLGEDGWLRTGDIASIDEDGFVTITDRKKDIIVTAGGKNIAPQNLENDLKTSRFVSQAMVVGDRRPYPAALITLDPVEIGKWAAEQGIDGDVAALAARPAGRGARRRDRRRRQPRALALRAAQALQRSSPRDFEMEHGEVTPTLKLKRRVVLEHFADEVERLYDTAPAPSARKSRRLAEADTGSLVRRQRPLRPKAAAAGGRLRRSSRYRGARGEPCGPPR